MTKDEMASYLVSLHSLIDAQTKGQHSLASTTLADEYARVWELLKETIQKENEDETRSSERERPVGSEDGAGIESSEPSGSRRLGEGEWDGANVPRSRIPSPDAG